MTPEPRAGLVRTLYRAAGLPAPDAPADGPLLARFLADRDEPAFAELVRRHGPMVLGVCRRTLGNSADTDDAFQATFLVLVRRAGGLTGRATVGNFLYGVAVRTALKARAAAMTRRAKEATAAQLRPTPAEPPDWLAVFDAELARLPDKYREALVLCDLEGLPRRDAAERLGVPDGTLSSRLATAKRMLADRLTRRGVTAPAVALTVAVPGSLAEAAVRAATGTASATVLSLSHEVMRAMLLPKLTAGAAVVLAAVAATGVVLAQVPRDGPSAAVPPTPAAPADRPAFEPAWKAEFREAYALADGQLVKRVAPPFPDCRAKWHHNDNPDAAGNGGHLCCLGFRWLNGRLNLKFTQANSVRPRDVTLHDVFVHVLDVSSQNLHARKTLLDARVGGDYVVRAGVSVEELVPALERILRDECKLKVRLSWQEVEREVVVVRGRFESKPLPGRKPNHVELYAKHLVPHGGKARNGFPDGFFEHLREFIGRPVVNEAEALPEFIGSHDNRREAADGIDTAEDTEPSAVLRRVEEQTGLTLRFGRRTVRVLSVTPDEPPAGGLGLLDAAWWEFEWRNPETASQLRKALPAAVR